MLRKTIAVLAAAAMLFSTASALPEGAFDLGVGVEASAEEDWRDEYYSKTDDGFYYVITPNEHIFAPEIEDGAAFIFGYVGEEKDLVIPETINGAKVLDIGGTFSDTVETITLPRYYNGRFPGGNMPAHLFWGISNLKEIIIDSENEKYRTLDGVLFTKDMKELVSFPVGKSGSYTVPNGVKTIEALSFQGCIISEVDLPDTLETIEGQAFTSSGLKRIIIPSSVKTMGDESFSVFWGSEQLTEIILNEGLEYIGWGCFDGTGISSITIPKSVTYIGERAMGYDNGNWDGNKLDGFKIYCYKGTAGEQYAIDNEFDYELLEDPVTHGDINGDGETGMKDLTALQRYLNGWGNAVTEAALDVNGDGEVNMRDLTYLQRMINGWFS